MIVLGSWERSDMFSGLRSCGERVKPRFSYRRGIYREDVEGKVGRVHGLQPGRRRRS